MKWDPLCLFHLLRELHGFGASVHISFTVFAARVITRKHAAATCRAGVESDVFLHARGAQTETEARPFH